MRVLDGSDEWLDQGRLGEAGGLPVLQTIFARVEIRSDLAGDGHQDDIRSVLLVNDVADNDGRALFFGGLEAGEREADQHHVTKAIGCRRWHLSGRKGDPGELGLWLVRVARIVIRLEHRWRGSGYRSQHYRRRLLAARVTTAPPWSKAWPGMPDSAPAMPAKHCLMRSPCSGASSKHPAST